MSARTIFLIAACLLLLSLTSCECGKKPNPKETSDVSGNTSYDPDSYKKSSTTVVNESEDDYSATYWYLYFHTAKFDGFTVSKLKSKDFSLIQAYESIRKKWDLSEDAYIGITFYSQVTNQCYQEYYNSGPVK